MTKQFVKKNIKLSLEFDSYLAKNPSLLEKIPNKGTVILTVKGDNSFNETSRSMVKGMRTRKSKVVEFQKQGKKWEISSPVHA